MSHRKDTDDPPKLEFNRTWSAPGKKFTPSQIIAQVLAEPTFNDILTCAVHYGLDDVRAAYDEMLRRDELDGLAAAICCRALRNIEIGFLRANKVNQI